MQTTPPGDKQQQRQELYSKLWNAVNTISINLSDWEFKTYLFSFLFFKYTSEKTTAFINSLEGSVIERQFKVTVFEEQHGYFIPQFATFEILRDRINKLCYDPIEELTSTIKLIKQVNKNQEFNKLLSWIVEASYQLDTEEHVQSGKALKQIINAVAELDIDLNDDSIDFIGEIYEYLIGINDKNSRKVAGQYYTPQELAELLALITTHDNKVETAYDPTCGSGGLLMAIRKQVKDVKIYGQEINGTSVKLCRMNMFMKMNSFNDFKIYQGDTLKEDKFADQQFDAIVGNPPFSLKWEGKKDPDIAKDPRFNGLIAPTNFADWAFLQHTIHKLKETGIAAITCFPGCLYRARVEQEIRKYFVENNYIDTIIQLPHNLFYGTTINVCVIVLKKNKDNKDILFIDASELCTVKPVRNYLENWHIQTILTLYKERKEVEGLSRLVTPQEIEQKDYSLTINDYLSKEEEEEKIDISKTTKTVAEEQLAWLRKNQKLDLIVREMDESLRDIPTMLDIARKWVNDEEERKEEEKILEPYRRMKNGG